MTDRGGLWFLAAAVLVAVGVSAGLLIAQPSAEPPSLVSDDNGSSTVALTNRTVDDARDVQLTVTTGHKQQLTSPATGLLSTFDCESGATISSWQSTVSVAGRPLLNLATQIPLWRNLRSGDTGDDVVAVQTELARLGNPITVDGIMGPHTISLVDARLKEVGAESPDPDVIERSTILWLPSPTVVAASCDALVGTTLSSGQPLVGIHGAVTGVSVTTPPDGLLPGERVLTVDGARFPLDPSGAVTDPADLIRFSALPSYANTTGSTDSAPGGNSGHGAVNDSGGRSGGGISGTLQLSTPITAWVVPPSALTHVDAQRACVLANGSPLAVTIVASSLGKSFITFADGVPAPAEVTLHPRDTPPC